MSDLKILTDNIEETALSQIYNMLQYPHFQNTKIRIMPDCHAGKGCVIGFTANLENLVPNLVGVDIGCGMTTINLGQIDLDLGQLDDIIRKYVPSGKAVHSNRRDRTFYSHHFYCEDEFRSVERLHQSIGTLGGGNHFIEVDKNERTGEVYLIVHSGSRNLGLQVANIYQQKAIQYCKSMSHDAVQKALKQEEQFREQAISDAKNTYVPDDLAYLSETDKKYYLNDLRAAQSYASLNRAMILDEILVHLLPTLRCSLITNISDFKAGTYFETIHNYIGDDDIIRKGAISAYKDELVLIPMNMRDGSLLASGLGNEDWNFSAPHGAGRTMSRAEAKRVLKLDDFQKEMSDVYSTSICANTLDEAPGAYKNSSEIVDLIDGVTVTVHDILTPIYNFKANS